jgi:hypothetical protein
VWDIHGDKKLGAGSRRKEIINERRSLIRFAQLHDALVHHGWRQEFEIAHLEFAAFFDQNDFEVEVWIKVRALFQFLYADPLVRVRLLFLMLLPKGFGE